MTIKQHGVSIGINRVDDDVFLSFKAQGKLTHDDFKTISPMINGALEGVEKRKVKVLFDASELEGWEVRAAWDDFNLSLKHGLQVDKIAVFGHKVWQDNIAKVANWFMAGELKFFEHEADALMWLNG
ncbi:STAS/SEC14 domain-containing protein [Marinobacter salinus]|uniref:STAS/SEC14 domain-containing protein n=1 Tax=Marinobacter salinus TaxID=1874317 RepID=A0A1D9GGX0_9GAMM|nr:STAS/SEC14 domain-containing protein [Marinobacter salinus]AOY86853.1 STAS/SEC14 domain-containing protein [Marinobacter salinus]